MRFLTVVASFAVMAAAVLANLSFDKSFAGYFITKSYGWPLIWHRYVLIIGGTIPKRPATLGGVHLLPPGGEA